MSGREIGALFAQQLASDPTIQMAYGRMDVALDRFFERALLITYRPVARSEPAFRAASGSGFVSRASRYLFRARSNRTAPSVSAGGPRPSSGRWSPATRRATRLMNEPVITLDDRDPFRTDILHEYFVAPARFAEFVKACQDGDPGVVPAAAQHHAALRRHRSRQRAGLRARAAHRRRDAVLAGEDGARRGRHGAHDARAHRARARRSAAPTTCRTGRTRRWTS